MCFVETIERIIHPRDEFRPVPWWAWTGRLEYGEMKQQIRSMFEQGIREYFLFPCYGLEYPIFLEDSWWDYVAFALEESERLGMKVWIYDDLSWPSGSAGGKVFQAHPEFRSQLLQFKRIPLAPGDVYYHEPSSEIVSIEYHKDNGEVIPVQMGPDYSWRNGSGERGDLILVVKAFYDEISLNSTAVAWNHYQRGALDLLNRHAVQAWMDCIHEQYYDHFSKWFGTVIKGFFCDEPRPNRCDGHSIPYTESLFEAFRKKYDYDIRPHLPKLFLNGMDDFKVRLDFWNLVTELLSENFTRPLAEWCAKRKVSLTGHTAPEEMCFQRNMLASCGDIQRILQDMSIPGCDLLGNQTPYFDDPAAPWYGRGIKSLRNTILTLKRPASIARFAGARRALCEAFGVRSWHGDMREQKRITDCLAAMGINFINDNSLTYTVSDFRHNLVGKHFTQPWWRFYSLFMEYSARLSAFASTGWIDAHVAILFPYTTLAGLTPADCNEPIPPEADLAEAINRTGDALLKNHVDFEYIFESVLETADISAGGIQIPGGEISILILPQSYLITQKIFMKLKEFQEHGGILLKVGISPRFIVSPTGQVQGFPDGMGTLIPLNDEFSNALLSEIDGHLSRSWWLEGEESEKVVTCMRTCGECHLLLVANQLPGTRRLRLRHSLARYTTSLDEGKVLETSSAEDIPFEMSEDQSLLFIFHDEEFPLEVPSISTGEHTVVTLDDKWEFSLVGDNHFLPECQLRFDPYDMGEKQNCFWDESDLWRPVICGKYLMGLSPEETRFYWMRCDIPMECVPSDLALITDNEYCEVIYVNGVRMTASDSVCVWDHHNRRFSIAKACRKGVNHICLKVRTSPWFSPTRGLTGYYEFRSVDKYPMLFIVSGSFGVRDGVLGPIPKTLQTGPWTSQGFPFFAGTGIYRQSFELQETPRQFFLEILDVKGVAEVELNHIHLGARAWKPYCFDVRNALRLGRNELAVSVAGSLGNILQRSYGEHWTPPREYGLTGNVIVHC